MHIFYVHSFKSRMYVLRDFFPLFVDLALKLFFLIFILLYFIIFFGRGIWLLVILIRIKTFPESLPLDFVCLVLTFLYLKILFYQYKSIDSYQIISFYTNVLYSESSSGMSDQIKHTSNNSCSSIKRASVMASIMNAFCSQNQASQPCVFS